MTVSGALARPMLAGIFIYGGIDALRDPEAKAKAADDIAPMIAQALRLPTTDTVTLVRINGGVQVAAGTLLAFGKFRRLAAAVLAASLLPTTYAGHRYWEEVDEDRRAQQRVQFLKNVAMLGGLVLAAGDTGGRPSVPWQARRMASHALAGAGPTTASAPVQLSKRAAKAAGKAAKAAGKAAEKAQLTKLAEEAQKQVQRLADTAKKSDISERALKAEVKAEVKAGVKAAKTAAKTAARKAKKGEYTERGLEAARKAGKKADTAELTRRAQRAARRAAKIAANKVKKVKAVDLPPQVLAAAANARQAAVEHLEAVERVRDIAAGAARDVAERAGEVLPIGS